jgi:hypothetical protein
MSNNQKLETIKGTVHSSFQEETYKDLKGEEKERAVMKEMAPFAIYAALPILLTIFIAYTFGTR